MEDSDISVTNASLAHQKNWLFAVNKMNTAIQMQVVVPSQKRKRQEEPSSIFVDSYKCPFGGFIAAKVHTGSSIVTELAVCSKPSPIEGLPYETFLKVISYLGPSTSLTSISCVNRRYNRFMRRIGDIMLSKAEHCFRYPPRSNDKINQESSISIFVRYSSYCSHVNKRLEILDRLLSSSDITGSRRECKERPPKRFRATNKGALNNLQLARALLLASNIDKVLDVADELISELSNSLSSPDQHICCSRKLEARVLATVGKVGGAVFKHSKAALAMIHQEGLVAYNGNIEDGIPPAISQELEKHVSLDMERIDKARVLMQKVVFYKVLFECNANLNQL